MQAPAGPGRTRGAQRVLFGRLRGSRRLTLVGRWGQLLCFCRAGGGFFARRKQKKKILWRPLPRPRPPEGLSVRLQRTLGALLWGKLPWVGLWLPRSGEPSGWTTPSRHASRPLGERCRVISAGRAPQAVRAPWAQSASKLRDKQWCCAHDFAAARLLLRRSRQAL